MQRPNEKKRGEIVAAAAKLFASRPFDQVSLDEISQCAKVGKGTLYVYFESKESLYQSLVRDGFRQIIDRMREQLAIAPESSRARLAVVAERLVDFAFSLPDLYRVMRYQIRTGEDSELRVLRGELVQLIRGVIEDGIGRGEVSDPRPDLTAEFVISFVRGVMMYPPGGLNAEMLKEHLLHVIWNGIGRQAR